MKVNDYVRTKDGLIHKITDNFNTTKRIATDNSKYVYEYNEIIKSSPNIIDLIEVGDYVNGCEVLDKYTYDNCDSHLIVNGNGFNVIMVEDIKSIVTKEQFERCEYKI